MQVYVGWCLCLMATCLGMEVYAQTATNLNRAQLQLAPTGSAASLRGVAAAGEVIWISGSHGTVMHSLNLGQQWNACGPGQHPTLDFRSLHAWDQQRAIIASAGTPAIVLKTSDGGVTWREVLRDDRRGAFFDGLHFIDAQRGVLFGDPIDGHFCVFTTTDAGESWQAIPGDQLPKTLPDEAAFAASNAAMIAIAPATIVIGTGGTQSDTSRILSSVDFGQSWNVAHCPLASGASSGIFALTASEEPGQLVAVGGDYRVEVTSTTTAAIQQAPGRSWRLAATPPTAYRSAVVFCPGNQTCPRGYYATGPSGTDYSSDGDHWHALSDTGFHALAVTPAGHVVAVGSEGRFAVLR